MHWISPDYLSEISGAFERFLFNLNGEADGMIMSGGTEIHFPPHMADEVCACIRTDERTKVKVRGIRRPAGGVIAAVAIEAIDSRRIVDKGPLRTRRCGRPPRTTRCMKRAGLPRSGAWFAGFSTARKERCGDCCSSTGGADASLRAITTIVYNCG